MTELNYSMLLCDEFNLFCQEKKNKKNNIVCRKCKPLICSLWNRPQVILAGCWNLSPHRNVLNIQYACGWGKNISNHKKTIITKKVTVNNILFTINQIKSNLM